MLSGQFDGPAQLKRKRKQSFELELEVDADCLPLAPTSAPETMLPNASLAGQRRNAALEADHMKKTFKRAGKQKQPRKRGGVFSLEHDAVQSLALADVSSVGEPFEDAGTVSDASDTETS
eukprot:6456823-Amphidinium_carterae.1